MAQPLTQTREARTTRAGQVRLGVWIEFVTIAWMVMEASVALSVGFVTRSVSLQGFGLDSIVELIAGGILLWRLLVEHLVQDGLIEKVPSQTDHRMVRLSLSAVGEQRVRDLNRTLSGLSERVLERVPASEREGVQKALSLLLVALLRRACALHRRSNSGSTASIPSSSSKPTSGRSSPLHPPASTAPVPATQASPSSRCMWNERGVGAAPVARHCRGCSRKWRRQASGSWCRGSLSRTRRAARCCAHRAFVRWVSTKSTPSWMACGGTW